MNNVTEVKECRLCGHKVESVIDFGLVPLANDFVEDAEDSKGSFPLNVIRCSHCMSVQLKHEVDPSVLFSEYSYTSPQALKTHFSEFVDTVTKSLELPVDAKVFEIGGNIGLLGAEFKERGYNNLYNVDPAENLATQSTAAGMKTYTEFFSKEFAEKFVAENGQVDLVVGLNVFAHIPNLTDIFDGIRILLKDTGSVVFENAYLLDTLKNADLGQFYLEHTYYHSILPLDLFLSKRDLYINDVTFNQVQCGSFRVFASPSKKSSIKVLDIIAEEISSIERLFGQMGERVEFVGKELLDILSKARERNPNRKIAIYGVPAKLALILDVFELSKFFDVAYEDASIKLGKLVPGTSIPIVSTEKIKELGPSDIIFIGAYNFADQIKEKLKDIGFKGFVIVPLPEVQIYG